MTRRTWAANLLFPPKCPYCQKILEDPRAPLCPACQDKLPWLTGPAAERKVDFAQGCFSPLAYRDAARDALLRYKFRPLRAYAQPFGELMVQCVRDHLTERLDGVTWAPLSRKRLWKRGFDQAELLARAVGEGLSLPVFPALKKTRDTRPQSELEEESARRANASGVYAPVPGADTAGKRLLLVDDVVTSGATLSECAGVLLRAGAAQVWCVTLAQAGMDEKLRK